MLKPDKTQFMDKDMLSLWETMKPDDLPDYRLYGGTALALYLNHRKSTDFDFFRTGPVTREALSSIPWLKSADFKGSRMMVDAVVKGKEREIKFNFISIEEFHVIAPVKTPITAQNGIEVAHPIDILASKLAAITKRKVIRDYMDIAFAHKKLPEELNKAIPLYLKDKMTKDDRPKELAKSINNFTYEIEYGLPEELMQEINKLIRRLSKARDVQTFIRQTDHDITE